MKPPTGAPIAAYPNMQDQAYYYYGLKDPLDPNAGKLFSVKEQLTPSLPYMKEISVDIRQCM